MTEIAFPLAVLGVTGTHLPAALRTFLLTLAVVDDLLASLIIALFYTPPETCCRWLPRRLQLGLFGLLVRRRVRSWLLLLPPAALTRGLVHLRYPRDRRRGFVRIHGGGAALYGCASFGSGRAFEHRWRRLSAGVAVPVFAFFARQGRSPAHVKEPVAD